MLTTLFIDGLDICIVFSLVHRQLCSPEKSSCKLPIAFSKFFYVKSRIEKKAKTVYSPHTPRLREVLLSFE